MANNAAEAGCIIPVILIMFYGLLVISKVVFSLMWIIPIIICVISILFSVDNPSKRTKQYKAIKNSTVQDHHKQVKSNNLNNAVRNHIPSSPTKNTEAIKLAKPQVVFCHFCGTRIELDAKPTKLTKLKTLFCHVCGTRIEPNALFCHQCGSKLE
jgi:hypothetical protein